MSTKKGLLDLPNELLVRITDLYFQDVKVELNHLGRRLAIDNAGFSSLMLTCKALSGIAEESFFENAEVYVDTDDVVHYRYNFASCPFVKGAKHTVVSRYMTDNHGILYPVQLFRYLSLDRSSFDTFLTAALSLPQKSLRCSYPFLRSLRTECSIRVPHGQTRMFVSASQSVRY